jgi:ATP diphosphatase
MSNPIPDPSLPPIKRLLEIMALLRDRNHGCAWDIEQNFQSIAPHTIEEAYEVADAIERRAYDDLKGELGDLLFQVVFHAQMAQEQGLFDFDAVADAVATKMIDRHPHIFGNDDPNKTADDQIRDWEKMKEAERAAKARTGVLDDIALGLPALMRAEKLQKRAARVGFDWPDPSGALDKIREEAAEITQSHAAQDPTKTEEEIGDLLFSVTNLARHLNVDPESALRRANAKFTRRFAYIETALATSNRTPSDSNLNEMDDLWIAAKAAGL